MLERTITALRRVPGMAALALGGSYARGTARPASDLDLGLYYAEAEPFAVEDVRRVAVEITGAQDPVVTDFYQWGPWVNGGAWIHTAAGKVDFLYRNLDQIQRTVDEAQQGILQHDYGQQPAYGFHSVIYLAETQICVPLHDPHARIAELKRRVAVYPPRLKQRAIVEWLWSAEFTLLHARDFAAGGEVYNTAGCLARVASALTQVLFALNETYFLSDKRVIQTIAGFPLQPAGYTQRLEAILAAPGRTSQELEDTVAELERLWQDVVALAGDRYQPKFHLG